MAVADDLLVELNKLEATGPQSCQAFFLFRNGTEEGLTALELSLAILDRDGVIDQLLSIDAAPAPAGRTALRLFEIPEIACEDISEIILHDAPACEAEAAGPVDCFERLRLLSRTDARFTL